MRPEKLCANCDKPTGCRFIDFCCLKCEKEFKYGKQALSKEGIRL